MTKRMLKIQITGMMDSLNDLMKKVKCVMDFNEKNKKLWLNLFDFKGQLTFAKETLESIILEEEL